MKKIFLILFLLIFFVPLIKPGNALSTLDDNVCYYCPGRDGYSVAFLPMAAGERPQCQYTAAFNSNEAAASDGVCSSTQTCDNYSGCVSTGGGGGGGGGSVTCTPPAGGCNDETNASCRSSATCTNIYCTVEYGGTVYQWTEDYKTATGQNGTCRTLTSTPSEPTGNTCTNDSGCLTGFKCVNGSCISPSSSGSCNGPEDCYSGKCVDGKCMPGATKIACIEDPAGSGKFSCKTALGVINTDPNGFAKSILRLFLGLAGGILLIMIILNGYKFMTSQGDPEKIKDAREGIIAAIAGILLIIFSIAILRLITVDIIGIPGFG